MLKGRRIVLKSAWNGNCDQLCVCVSISAEKKPKAKKEKPADSYDAVSDLFAQMSLQTDTDPDAALSSETSQKPPQPDSPPSPEIPAQRSPASQNSPSVSALIGQLHLSSIDWDSSSFTASPSSSDQTDPRPAESSTRSLKERIMVKNTRTQHPKSPESLRSIPSAAGATTKTNLEQNPSKKPAAKTGGGTVCKTSRISDDSDVENRPGSQKPRSKVKVTSKPQRPQIPQKSPDYEQMRSFPAKTPEKPASLVQVHHGKVEDEDSDASVDSPRPLAERLKMRFAKWAMKHKWLFVWEDNVWRRIN